MPIRKLEQTKIVQGTDKMTELITLLLIFARETKWTESRKK